MKNGLDKIVSVISLTKELKNKYPDNDFVPVYWMATEDHDFEEVNHFNLFKKKYQLSNSQNGAVGKLKLEGVEDLLSQLKEDLVDYVTSMLKKHELNSEVLKFEITESTLLFEPETAISTMWELSKKGITLALDDFGTGFSSL